MANFTVGFFQAGGQVVDVVPNAGQQIPDAGKQISDAGKMIPNMGKMIPNAGQFVHCPERCAKYAEKRKIKASPPPAGKLPVLPHQPIFLSTAIRAFNSSISRIAPLKFTVQVMVLRLQIAHCILEPQLGWLG